MGAAKPRRRVELDVCQGRDIVGVMELIRDAQGIADEQAEQPPGQAVFASDHAVASEQRAKTAASAALVATGATITHHHAVGTDHRPWMTDEIGPLGVSVLKAVKDVLDPTGVLNPGKLLPDRTSA